MTRLLMEAVGHLPSKYSGPCSSICLSTASRGSSQYFSIAASVAQIYIVSSYRDTVSKSGYCFSSVLSIMITPISSLPASTRWAIEGELSLDISMRISGWDRENSASGPENRNGLRPNTIPILAMVSAGIDVIRLPKTDSAEDVAYCEELIARAEEKFGRGAGSTAMMAAIESAQGVLNAPAIAKASPRLIGIALGAEDYVTDLKTTRSDGTELMFARSMILHAARAAGIAALDTVYSDVNNEAGLIAETELIKKLGFDGKSVINPRQIKPIVKVFTPTQKKIDNAMSVMSAIKEAEAKGSGVIARNGRMIDRPIVLRAERVLMLAKAAGIKTGGAEK